MRKENETWNNKTSVSIICMLVFIVMIMTCVNACGFFGIGSTSWKEEVLLHDGTKIVVERYYHLGGKRTLDSTEKRNLDETVTFTLPGSNKKVTWKMDFRDSVPEPNSLDLLVLDIVNGTPYIATNPRGCIAYNKWERPNPPYIFFKYDGNYWKRISLNEFPAEISKVNVIIERPPAKLLKSFYTVEQVNEQNHNLREEIFKTIVRSPLKGKELCPVWFFDGRYWRGAGGLEKLPSYEACVTVCNQKRISMEYCPCKRVFDVDAKGEK